MSTTQSSTPSSGKFLRFSLKRKRVEAPKPGERKGSRKAPGAGTAPAAKTAGVKGKQGMHVEMDDDIEDVSEQEMDPVVQRDGEKRQRIISFDTPSLSYSDSMTGTEESGSEEIASQMDMFLDDMQERRTARKQETEERTPSPDHSFSRASPSTHSKRVTFAEDIEWDEGHDESQSSVLDEFLDELREAESTVTAEVLINATEQTRGRPGDAYAMLDARPRAFARQYAHCIHSNPEIPDYMRLYFRSAVTMRLLAHNRRHTPREARKPPTPRPSRAQSTAGGRSDVAPGSRQSITSSSSSNSTSRGNGQRPTATHTPPRSPPTSSSSDHWSNRGNGSNKQEKRSKRPVRLVFVNDDLLDDDEAFESPVKLSDSRRQAQEQRAHHQANAQGKASKQLSLGDLVPGWKTAADESESDARATHEPTTSVTTSSTSQNRSSTKKKSKGTSRRKQNKPRKRARKKPPKRLLSGKNLVERTTLPKDMSKWALVVEPYLEQDPESVKERFHKTPDIMNADLESMGCVNLSAVLINPPWEAGAPNGARERLLHINQLYALNLSRRVLPNGFIFIWCPKEYIPQLFIIMARWKVRYVENLVWIQTQANNRKVTAPYKVLRRSKMTLYIFLREPRPEIKHQRSSDVHMGPVKSPYGLDWNAKPEQVKQVIETMLPAWTPEDEQRPRFAELWANERTRVRDGWIHVCEEVPPERSNRAVGSPATVVEASPALSTSPVLTTTTIPRNISTVERAKRQAFYVRESDDEDEESVEEGLSSDEAENGGGVGVGGVEEDDDDEEEERNQIVRSQELEEEEAYSAQFGDDDDDAFEDENEVDEEGQPLSQVLVEDVHLMATPVRRSMQIGDTARPPQVGRGMEHIVRLYEDDSLLSACTDLSEDLTEEEDNNEGAFRSVRRTATSTRGGAFAHLHTTPSAQGPLIAPTPGTMQRNASSTYSFTPEDLSIESFDEPAYARLQVQASAGPLSTTSFEMSSVDTPLQLDSGERQARLQLSDGKRQAVLQGTASGTLELNGDVFVDPGPAGGKRRRRQGGGKKAADRRRPKAQAHGEGGGTDDTAGKKKKKERQMRLFDLVKRE